MMLWKSTTTLHCMYKKLPFSMYPVNLCKAKKNFIRKHSLSFDTQFDILDWEIQRQRVGCVSVLHAINYLVIY